MKKNLKTSRKHSEDFLMDEIRDIKRSKQMSNIPRNYFSSINLMQFVEISPLNSTLKPHARSGHRAVATDSDFWIWGGYHPSVNLQSTMFNELWRFNFALQRWTQEPTTGDGPTSTVASHSMYLYHNLVFVFGGTGYPFGHNVSNELYILDLRRRHWRRCQLLNQQPERVYGASMIMKNEHLYILCGTNSMRYHTDVYDIHLPTLTCTQIGHTFDELEDFFEGGRYRQEVYLHDDKIYVFGGGSSTGLSLSLENLPVFDLINRSWSFIHTNPDPVHNFPPARKFHTVLPFRQNQVIVFGGAYLNPTSNHHNLVDGDLWIFNLNKFEWSKLSSLTMVRPTYFHAAAINERGEIWTHGGVAHQSSSINNETRITTLFKMHTQVLKLSELSWNYFLQCLSDRTCLLNQPQLMTQLHIPTRFSERIY